MVSVDVRHHVYFISSSSRDGLFLFVLFVCFLLLLFVFVFIYILLLVLFLNCAVSWEEKLILLSILDSVRLRER